MQDQERLEEKLKRQKRDQYITVTAAGSWWGHTCECYTDYDIKTIKMKEMKPKGNRQMKKWKSMKQKVMKKMKVK